MNTKSWINSRSQLYNTEMDMIQFVAVCIKSRTKIMVFLIIFLTNEKLWSNGSRS